VGGLETVSSTQLIDFVVEGNNSLIGIFKFVFISYPYGLEAIFASDLLNLGLYLIITVVILGGFLLLSNFIYFRGVLGINETASKRKVLSNKQLLDSSQSKPAIFRYFLKEIALLFRTPIYFLNCVSVGFLLPIILLVSTLSVPSQREAVLNYINTLSFSDPNIIGFILIGSLAIGLVIGSTNMISSTAISREGSNVYFMKIIPMSIMSQLHAKVLSGVFYSTLGLIFLYGIVFYFIRLPWHLFLASFGLTMIGTVFINYYSILIDVIHPKLVWESEQAAVKQNMNFLFTMLPAMGIAGLMFYLIPKITISMVIVAMLAAIILILLTLVIITLLKKIASKTILNY
jgi:ABC-2 type transport system permease protein